MSRDSDSESRFENQTGHQCKEWRFSPSDRCPGTGSYIYARNATGAESPVAGICQRTRPAKNLYLGLLAMTLLWVVPVLACGSFQPRPTPTRDIPVAVPAAETPVPDEPTPTAPSTAPPSPTQTSIPSPTPTVAVRNPLTIGEPARITVPGGLNVREQPTIRSPAVTLLAQDKRITVLEGPVSSDGYIWWKVDDNQGTVGWVAGGQGIDDWISPHVGEARPIDRSPVVGDRVIVTLNGELTVRSLPGIGSSIVARARTNQTFSVVAGPQAADGYFWYQIRSDDGAVEGWAADGREGERWLSPLE
ncbi:MAG: SH3 domain-containing protein [Caldilineaceae bacterium SB0664_bin_27]|uniref:SH3 domain-containing protein n=1 Tax=Caldilineaceae bacterium SB0664_bin_27 TaxID=2605260 RepID=A0A6B0YTJ5_9CHLR|nr:SH3 domain-containing protein [Caldilineaceae bacterium SB0664_bin_27]